MNLSPDPYLSCRSVFVNAITCEVYFVIPIDTRPAAVKLRLTEQAKSLRQRPERWQHFYIFLYIREDLIAIIKLWWLDGSHPIPQAS